jgi:threonine 3-dehydrogenase
VSIRLYPVKSATPRVLQRQNLQLKCCVCQTIEETGLRVVRRPELLDLGFEGSFYPGDGHTQSSAAHEDVRPPVRGCRRKEELRPLLKGQNGDGIRIEGISGLICGGIKLPLDRRRHHLAGLLGCIDTIQWASQFPASDNRLGSNKTGTTGAVFLMDYCGECRSCRQGFTNQCLQKRGDMGFNRDGGYGQYELIHENIFFPVPDEFSATEATLLLDIMGTGGHAIGRCQLMRPDIESLLVLGAGPIGLGVLAMAKIILGEQLKVMTTDVVPYRLQLAERLGGLPINIAQSSLSTGLKLHGLDRVDMTVDTSGKQAARQEALHLIEQRGSLICVGHGEGIALKISPDIIAPERSIVGSEYFRYNEMPANLERLRHHRTYLDQIVTHHMTVDQIQRAFETFFFRVRNG